jgi:preprotein translocase subunit SecG
MYILLTVIHVIVCLFLVVVVLLQSGKAADLAGAFGGMGSQTVFGPRGGATVLSRATTIAAALFMVTSLSLSIMATRSGRGSSGTLLDKARPAATKSLPATPQPGQTTPLGIQTGVDGKMGEKKTVDVPLVPDPTKPQGTKQPQQKK